MRDGDVSTWHCQSTQAMYITQNICMLELPFYTPYMPATPHACLHMT
jgi:hypothetical protein